eukprot:scpid41536/ scgid22985/ 
MHKTFKEKLQILLISLPHCLPRAKIKLKQFGCQYCQCRHLSNISTGDVTTTAAGGDALGSVAELRPYAVGAGPVCHGCANNNCLLGGGSWRRADSNRLLANRRGAVAAGNRDARWRLTLRDCARLLHAG